MTLTSLYIHIPFCVHRCGYCDFNTYAGIVDLIPGYVDSICQEIKLLSDAGKDKLPIHTIYFGGGTPSLLPTNSLEKILATIGSQFHLVENTEISLEANPGTVSREYLLDIHSLGINRLSLGMQSADQEELSMLERQHTFQEVIQAVTWARSAGFDNLNLDLIFGLPDQSLNTWNSNLGAALSLQPDHLSLYALTLDHGTPLQHKIDRGRLAQPDPDMAADMYEAASEVLANIGFMQYEISNWARASGNGKSFECQHNLQYWRNLPYLGIGAGAHGFVTKKRTVNVSTPGSYIQRLTDYKAGSKKNHSFPRTPASAQILPIDLETEIGETMMTGLRLVNEGVSNQDFLARFGIRLEQRFGKQIDHLIGLGLLEWAGSGNERLRLSHRGRLLGNRVFCEFI